jgi:hypothetical protein
VIETTEPDQVGDEDDDTHAGRLRSRQ